MTDLERIIGDFAAAGQSMKAEILLDYSRRVPEISEQLQKERDEGTSRVHECATPVFLWVDVHDGNVIISADVAEDAPTVKGFVGLLMDGLNGKPVEEVLSAPNNIIDRMGLTSVLGMRRMIGLSVILQRIKREAASKIGRSRPATP